MENGLEGVHGLGAVWIGRPRSSHVGALLPWFPAVATSPSVLSQFSELIVCDLVHSLGNGILVDQISAPLSVFLPLRPLEADVGESIFLMSQSCVILRVVYIVMECYFG